MSGQNTLNNTSMAQNNATNPALTQASRNAYMASYHTASSAQANMNRMSNQYQNYNQASYPATSNSASNLQSQLQQVKQAYQQQYPSMTSTTQSSNMAINQYNAHSGALPRPQISNPQAQQNPAQAYSTAQRMPQYSTAQYIRQGQANYMGAQQFPTHNPMQPQVYSTPKTSLDNYSSTQQPHFTAGSTQQHVLQQKDASKYPHYQQTSVGQPHQAQTYNAQMQQTGASTDANRLGQVPQRLASYQTPGSQHTTSVQQATNQPANLVTTGNMQQYAGAQMQTLQQNQTPGSQQSHISLSAANSVVSQISSQYSATQGLQRNQNPLMHPRFQTVNTANISQYPSLQITKAHVRPSGLPGALSHTDVRHIAPRMLQTQYQTPQVTSSLSADPKAAPYQSNSLQTLTNAYGQVPQNMSQNSTQQRFSYPNVYPYGVRMPQFMSAPSVVQPNQQNQIVHDVEYVFNENGKKVVKMPIKIGEDTTWVDVQQDSSTVLDASGKEVQHPPLQKDWRNNPNPITDALKKLILEECCEKFVSPAQLASKHEISVVQVRKVVKDAGKKLPTKYNTMTNTNADKGQSKSIISGLQAHAISVKGQMQSIPLGQATNKFLGMFGGNNTSVAGSIYQKQTPPDGISIIKSGIGQRRIGSGQLALCSFCGNCSSDFKKCDRCNKPISEDSQENQNKARRKNQDDIIALSSNEDDDDDDPGKRQHRRDRNDIRVITSVGNNLGRTYALLHCRSIRVGSHKSMGKEKCVITENKLQITVSAIGEPTRQVPIVIKKSEIDEIEAHFGRGMPVLFINCTKEACERIRVHLKMTSKASGTWFEKDCTDETMRLITLLPEKMTDDTKDVIMRYYGKLIKELENKAANEKLVNSSKKETRFLGSATIMGMTKDLSHPGFTARSSEPQSIQKYCQYPPDGNASVSVSSEDYYCLEQEQFLNDTTIDFYFKWLLHSIMKAEDRDRTHIFSTFFYKRLTTPPKQMKNKVHPVEDDPNLTPAEKRYERVKRWTKKINLFEKDFIVVPINEHQHWFVALICFPGTQGCYDLDGKAPCEEPPSQKRAFEAKRQRKKKKTSKDGSAKKVMQIGSTSIIPLKGTGTASSLADKMGLDDELSDRDEADASDEDIFNPDDDILIKEAPAETSKDQEQDKDKPSADKNDNKTSTGNDKTNNEEKDEKEDSAGAARLQNLIQTLGKSKKKDDSKNASTADDKSSGDEKAKEDQDKANEKRIRQPCILIFDSLQSESRAKIAATLRDYLACEYKGKMGQDGKPRIFDLETFPANCPKVPQQPNFSDCGIYLLQYIETFFEAPISNYSLPITSLKRWFPNTVVKHKRAKIAEIIRNLAMKQNPDKKLTFPQLEFVGTEYDERSISDDDDDDDSDEDDDDDDDDDDMDLDISQSSHSSMKRNMHNASIPGVNTLAPNSTSNKDSGSIGNDNGAAKSSVGGVTTSNVNTTTINLGSNTAQDGNKIVNQSYSNNQPRVITFPSSSSMSLTNVSVNNQNNSSSGNAPNVNSTSTSNSNPHSFGAVKVLSAPSGSFLQPMSLSVSNVSGANGKPAPHGAQSAFSNNNADKVQQLSGGNSINQSTNNNNENQKVVLGPQRKKYDFQRGSQGGKSNVHNQFAS